MMGGTSFLRVICRMKPGMTLAQVKAALPSLDQSYRTEYPNKIDSSLTTTVRTLPEDVTQNFRAGFITLFAAVSFVLLIACSNVANLLLVRFSGRRREIALRMAIGASRSSVVRLFVFESLLVSAIAGVAGAFVAWRLVPLVPRMASNFLPFEANTASSVSVVVLLFTIALSLLTGLLMGVYPAMQASRADLVDGLKEGGRGTSGSIRQQRLRKILVGRDVNEHGTVDSQNVVLISQTGAKKVLSGENPIGKTLLVTSAGTPCEIVGIVGDIRSQRIKEEPGMEFYRPWSQENFPFVSIAVLSTLNTEAVTKLAQSALSKVNPGLAIAVPQSMDAIVAQALGQARWMMWLLGIFAGVAILLASIGIYGAVAYSVEQRTVEIGLRLAPGAQTADVLRLVVRQGMAPVLLGLVIGIVAALALGRLLTTQLYEVSPHNPALLAITALTLGAVALLACFLPARRATFVNPIEALRTE